MSWCSLPSLQIQIHSFFPRDANSSTHYHISYLCPILRFLLFPEYYLVCFFYLSLVAGGGGGGGGGRTRGCYIHAHSLHLFQISFEIGLHKLLMRALNCGPFILASQVIRIQACFTGPNFCVACYIFNYFKRKWSVSFLGEMYFCLCYLLLNFQGLIHCTK